MGKFDAFSSKKKREKFFLFLFNISMFFKFLDGVVELIGGLAFELIKKEKILKLFTELLQTERAFQIPNETILRWATSLSHMLSTNLRLFISIILIGNGIIKIVLSISLLMRKYLAFPIALIFLMALYIYQIVQTIETPSLFFYLMDAFDMMVILVILREYLVLKREKKI